MRLRATLTNHTSNYVKHVGVLVGNMEYEFNEKLAPFETRENRFGASLELLQRLVERKLERNDGLPESLSPNEAPLGHNAACWARYVEYADGSSWAVNPL